MRAWPRVLGGLIAGALLLGAASALAAEMTLKPGASYVFALGGNPSTGYVWRLNRAGSNNLAIVKVEDLGYGTSSGRIGAPASYQFRITGVAPGSARLRFDYVRPWVGTPIKTKELAVRVE